MTRSFLALTLTLTLTLALALSTRAADWPQFRGPGGSAVSPETNLPAGFSDSSGVRWKVDLPGKGLSSPVVVGGRVYVTAGSGPNDDRLHVLCFDAGTGKRLWQRQFAATGSTIHHPTTHTAAPTPAADDTGVFALFSSGDLVAVNADGSPRWVRSLAEDYPAITNQLGLASSLALAGGKLIVAMDNSGDSFVAAIDAKTGANAWKVARPREISWSSPLVRGSGASAEVIFQGAKDLTAFDLATGAKKWTAKYPETISSPSVVGDTLLAPSGGVALAKIGAGGPVEAWKGAKLQTGMSSPLLYDGKVYAANPRAGILTCADAKTGAALWQERVQGPFSGSPVAGDGKIYLVNEAGTLFVFKAGDEAEQLGKSEIKDKVQSTPAISGGAVFVRGEKSLICVGPKLGG